MKSDPHCRVKRCDLKDEVKKVPFVPGAFVPPNWRNLNSDRDNNYIDTALAETEGAEGFDSTAPLRRVRIQEASQFKELAMSLREEIAQQALELPAEDRAYVADVIEQSLASGGFASDEIAVAWASEIERRIAAFDRGEVEAVGAEVALERLRKQLAEYLTRKTTPRA